MEAMLSPSLLLRHALPMKRRMILFALQNSVVSDVKGQGWVVDSEATSCATYDASDCRDIRDCNITRCLFLNIVGVEKVAVLLWVDDFLIYYEKEDTFTNFMSRLRTKFTVTSVGPLSSFLGMEMIYSSSARTLSICQSNTVSVLLERASMTDCNTVSTPCPAGTVFTKKDCPAEASTNNTVTEYRSLIALANFISCWTRPDITFTVNKLCKYMANPGETHWKLLKHLLRYLKGTMKLALQYSFANADLPTLRGYSDSSFADCPDTGRSTLAYTFLYGSAILSWYSKLNTYVTTCTNHSEYNALALAAKESEWLILLFSQLDSAKAYTPLPIYVDNSGIVSMVFNPVDHQSNKHVRIGCHYTRELFENKTIVPIRVPTDENIADIFTKPLAATKFKTLSAKLLAETKSPQTQHATTLMLTAHDNDGPVDSEIEEVESKRTQTDFEVNWPYPSVLKQTLGASSYDVNRTGETFSTGREKLEVIFYRLNQLGRKVELSKHDAMELTSRTGHHYIVCSRNPKAHQHATIHIVQPSPTLTCTLCKMINTPAFALLQCSSCNAKSFEWSCGCVHTPI